MGPCPLDANDSPVPLWTGASDRVDAPSVPGNVVALTGALRAVMPDARDGDRGVMATWHLDQGLLVLSMWRGDTCVASAQLHPSQAAELSQLISQGLGDLMSSFEPMTIQQTG